MKFLKSLLCLLPILLSGQVTDTTVAEFIKYGDFYLQFDANSTTAMRMYTRAVQTVDLSVLTSAEKIELLSKAEIAAQIAQTKKVYKQAQYLYLFAWQLSKQIGDREATLRIIPHLAQTYEDMRNAGTANAIPRAEAYETADVYYNIVGEPEIVDGQMYVKIKGGLVDGIYQHSVGTIYGRYTKDYGDRGNTKLGVATVYKLDTNFTILKVTPDFEQIGENKILNGDMAMMMSRIPMHKYKSLLWQLSVIQIVFYNNQKDPIYDYRQLLQFDSPELEADILEIMRRDVYETWEWLSELEDRSEQSAVFLDTMKSGRFMGITVFDAMEKTTADDLRSFLGFVRVYPGKYMGTPWKINETYATWVLNNSPIGFDEFFELVMAAKTQKDFEELVNKYRAKIIEDDFITRVSMASEEKARQKMKAEALDIARRMGIIAELIGDEKHMGWYNFAIARVYDHFEQKDSLIFYYEKSIPYFERSGDIKGAASSLNNIGSEMYSAQNYEQGLVYYKKALDYKIQYLRSQNNAQTEYLTVAKSASGVGLCFQTLAQYDSAIFYFDKSIAWCDSAQSSDARAFAVDVLNNLAKVYKKRGQFDEALKIYNIQLQRYRQLGNDAKVADVLDNIADINFDRGNYNTAFAEFYEAYQLKIKEEKWNGAGFSMSNCGQAMWNIGELDSAIACHNLALQLREKGKNKSGMAFSLAKIAALYKAIGKPDDAEKYYQQAIDIYLEAGDSLKVAELSNSVGKFYYDLKSYAVALDFYDYAYRMYSARNLKSELADVLSNQGEVYFYLKNYKLAKEKYSRALALRREMNERQNIMYSLVDVSFITLYSEYNIDTTMLLLNEAVLLAEETGSQFYLAFCYQHIGNAYSYLAQTSEAESYYRKALTIYQESDYISSQTRMLNYLGSNEMQRGEFEKALVYYNQSLALAQSKNLRVEVAEAFIYMSEYHYYKGEFSKSFVVLDSAYSIYREANNAYGIASTNISEGNTHNLMGNASRAFENYRIADSIYIFLEDPLSRATALNNMGTISFQQGDYTQCLRLFGRCMEILDSVGLKLSLAVTVTGNLGEVYMERGIWSEAIEYYNKSIALAEELGATRQVWGNKIMMAKLYAKQGKHNEAIEIASLALDVYQKSDEKMAIAESATILGKAYFDIGKKTEARKHLNTAIKTYRDIGSKKLIWEPLYYLAQVEQADGQTLASVALLQEAVDTLEILSNDLAGDNAQKRLFAKAQNKVDIYQSLITQMVLAGNVKGAWVYQEKFNVYGLAEQTRSGDSRTRGADNVGADGNLMAELELKKDGIYNQLMKEKSKPANERSDKKIAELERLMSVASEDYQNFLIDLVEQGEMNIQANTVNPEMLDQKRYDLPDKMAVVQYLVTAERLIIFVATNDTLAAKIIDIEKENIEKFVNGYYALIVNKAPIQAIDAAAEQLYKVLVEPIKNLIENKTHLALVPTGILMKLPFHSLGYTKGEDFEYMVSRIKIFYINDMSSTDIREALNMKEANLIAFGNPDLSLPYAETEVNNISQFFNKSQLYVKAEAREDIAKTEMNKFKIVHFATHGNLDPIKFNSSYLTLAPNIEMGEDGMFTIGEINRINLRNCQLIVLSACNTAVNDSKLDGWINNPAKAFLTKGAKSTIASLWAVDDAATGLLMQHFYQNLMDGQNKVDALTSAQRTLMTHDKFFHPYYWAAFELIGQWE